MIPLSHPILADYLAAVRFRPCYAHAFALQSLDRLQEATAMLCEEGGPTLADACWWYALGSDEDEAALREMLATVDEITNPDGEVVLLNDADRPFRLPMRERRELVRTMPEHMHPFTGMITYPQSPKVACRDLRRRVLRLYKEVVCEARAEISQYEYPQPPTLTAMLADFFIQCGFRLDLDNGGAGSHPMRRAEDRESRRWVYTQTLTAADLIPPGMPTYGPLPLDEFNRLRETMGLGFNIPASEVRRLANLPAPIHG